MKTATWLRGSLSLGFAAALALPQAACSNDAYCYACGDDLTADAAGGLDAGGTGGSSGFDASFGDGISLDSNNCNADLTSDPLNCGACGNVCNIPNAFAKCEDNFCIIDRCASGYYDLDGKVDNGCEYECEPLRDQQGNPLSEESVCDERDDDCDGLVDEIFDLKNSPAHCGGCNLPCTSPPNSLMKCVNGACQFDRCADDYEDANEDVNPQSVEDGSTDGCECNRIGAELCNYIDDDCDTKVDEGFVLESDNENCGACGNACGSLFLNALTTCENFTCVFGGCLPGYYDSDGVQANGCEYECTPADPPNEVCNGEDDDCNGFADDGTLPGVGATCGSSTGECETGRQQCVNGALACVGGASATPELCDGLNNDCDATTDEGCPTASPPARLDVGGSTAGQHSTAQLTVAGQGNATFAAYLDRRSGNADIRLNYLPTPGGSWLAADLVVANSSAGEVEPWVFTSPTTLYVAYGRFTANVRRIQLARTNLTPGAFTTVQVEKSAPATADSFFVRGVVAGQAGGSDQLVLVWQVLSGTSRNIYLQASSDGGATWLAADLRVNGQAGKAELPSLATDGQGHAFVAWRDGRGAQPEVYFSRYDVATATLSANAPLSVGNPTKPPVVAADAQGNVHVAWTDLPPDPLKKRIRVASSTNAGAAFGASVVVNTPAFADADTPHIVARQGRAVAVWEDNRSGLSDIYGNVWSAGSWRQAASRADAGPRGAYRSAAPRVAFGAGNRVFVAYQEYRGTGALNQADVHANFSEDLGLTFQPQDVRLDPGAVGLADSITPFLYAPGASGPGNEPVVVWLDNLAGAAASANADVYAARLDFP